MAITISGSGTITGLSAGGLPNDSVTSANIASLAASKLTGQVPDANAPSGSVIQVVSATKTDAASFTGGTLQDITGLSVSITPASASSKFLVMFTVYANNITDVGSSIRLMRNSTAICVGDTAGNRTPVSTGSSYRSADPYGPYALTNEIVDSPATTSTITYKLQTWAWSGTTYINRSSYDTDATQFPRTASSIIVMEIAG